MINVAIIDDYYVNINSRIPDGDLIPVRKEVIEAEFNNDHILGVIVKPKPGIFSGYYLPQAVIADVDNMNVYITEAVGNSDKYLLAVPRKHFKSWYYVEYPEYYHRSSSTRILESSVHS